MKSKILSILLCITLSMTNVAPVYAAQPSPIAESEREMEEGAAGETSNEMESQASNASENDAASEEESPDDIYSETSTPAEETEPEGTVPSAEDTASGTDSRMSESTESGDNSQAPITPGTESTDSEISLEEITEDIAVESEEELVGATVGLSVASHTQSQIRSYLKSSGVSVYASSTYAVTPNTTAGSYDPGKLSDATLNNALGVVNLIRYIAGLNYDVTLDDTYTEKAQAASFVNCLNGMISHYPERPDGVSDSLYEKAYEGAHRSNLSYGYTNFGYSLLLGQMADSSSSDNLACVGHRRWILNPRMGKVGFGQTSVFQAVYAHDSSRNGTETNVAWPAQNMPVEFFKSNYPWSISTGQTEDISKIKVTLKRVSDGEQWTFAEDNTDSGYFNVNNTYYGATGCIIFRPGDITYNSGDVFQVTITGAKAGTIRYTVSFFELYPIESVTLSSTNLTIECGTSKRLTAKPYPAESGSTSVTWTSENSEVCTVSASGYVKAVSAGTTRVIAEIDGKKAACTVTVKATSISDANIYLYKTEYTYTGKAIEAIISSIYKNNKSLKEGTDYKLSFSNNTNVGTATVTITGIGNYTGKTSVTYTIVPCNLANATVSSISAQAYTGSQIKPVPTVSINGTKLTLGVDYTLSYGANVEPSTGGSVVIKAKSGNVTGSKTVKFAITKASVASATVAGVSLSYGYSGNAYAPELTVRLAGVTLVEGKDYTVTYANNVEPGTASITIIGKGSYTGTKVKTFEIVDCVSTLVSGKTYQLIPKNNSTTAVCAYSGKMVNNTKVYITNRSSSEAMRFKAIKNADGTWKFINSKCELALAVQQNSSALGAGVVLYDQTDKAAQNWKMVRKWDNSFAIINAVTGYSIAMSDASAVKGTTLSMAETASNGLQRFYVVETEAVDAPFDGTYAIRASKNRAYSISIASSSGSDGANVQLSSYSGSRAQTFTAMHSGGVYYRLVNVNSGLVLTVKGNTKTNGANVIQSTWKAQSGQKWRITENADGTVTLTNALGTIMHLNGNKTADGTNIAARNAMETGAQRWYLD